MTSRTRIAGVLSDANDRLTSAIKAKVDADKELEIAVDEQSIALTAYAAVTADKDDFYLDQGRKVAARALALS